MSTFTAAPQALGYLYQARYALYLALSRPDAAQISIEKFDDIAFDQNGTVTELLQLKHHVTPGALTDSSPDLWKTIRVWSTAIKQGEMQPSETIMLIVTTANAPDNSATARLRPGKGRDSRLALERLKQIVQSSRNQALTLAFDAFQQLAPHEQQALLDSVYVIDCASDITNVKSDIEQHLRLAVRPQHIAALYERLEGWWFGQIIDQLAGRSTGSIPCADVRGKIADLREQFRADALPIDVFELDEANAPLDDRQFVIQLQEVCVKPERINKAIQDHDRAFAQRSKWLREELIDTREIDGYEARLVDEWEREVLAQKDIDDTWQSTDEEQLRQFGWKIFHWADRVADIKIRPMVSELHIMRGSYHMLADQSTPRVWWHPQFRQRRLKGFQS